MGKRLFAVVTGSSNSGRSCISELLRRDEKDVLIRGVFRSVAKASECASRHVGRQDVLETLHGVDAYDTKSLQKAFENATSAMIVTPLDHSRGMDDDALLTIRIIDAAIAATTVTHVVLVGSWTTSYAHILPSLAQRFVQPETHLRQQCEKHNIHYTIIRGGFFMTNYLTFAEDIRQNGVVRSSNYSVAACDPGDIGRMAASILLDHHKDSSKHSGQCYEVSGSQRRDLSDVVRVIADAIKKPVVLDVVSAREFVAHLPQAFKELFVYLEDKGPRAVPCSDDFARVTGLSPVSLEDWVSRHVHLFK